MPTNKGSSRTYSNSPTADHLLPSYDGGYNDYAQSPSQIKDNEISSGINVRADDNGAMADRNGKTKASPMFPMGYKTAALGKLKTTVLNLKLALHGDTAYSWSDTSLSALTGVTFTPNDPRDCKIIQAVGRAYFFNRSNTFCYSSDGSTLTSQTNAFPLLYGIVYGQRIYGVRPNYPDRIYFSNPVTGADNSGAPSEPTTYAIGNFGTFDVNLAPAGTSPVKNAGFIQLGLDEGVDITSITQKGTAQGASYLQVRTLAHGIWYVQSGEINATSKTLGHDFGQSTKAGNCPATLSVFTSDNDELHYGGDNIYFYGELKFYQQPKVTPKSGRVQTSIRNIPPMLRSDVVGIAFENAEYIFYGVGGFNDRVLVRDTVLNAWSTPYLNWNVSCAEVYQEPDGRVRLMAGSSDVNNPYIFQLESGTTDDGAVINANFGDKNTDMELPGIPKSMAFTQVFYSYIQGSISFDIFLDGKMIKTGVFPKAGSNALAIGEATGVGTQVVGSSELGVDGDLASSGIPTYYDSYFTIPHGFLRGEKLRVVIRKGNSYSRFRILKRKTYFKKKKPLPN